MDKFSNLLYDINEEDGVTKEGIKYTKYYLDDIKQDEELQEKRKEFIDKSGKDVPLSYSGVNWAYVNDHLHNQGTASILLFETENKIALRTQRYIYFKAKKKAISGRKEKFGPTYLSITKGFTGITIRLTKNNKIHAIRFGRRGRNYKFHSIKADRQEEIIKQWIMYAAMMHDKAVRNQLEFIGENSLDRSTELSKLILGKVEAKLEEFKRRANEPKVDTKPPRKKARGNRTGNDRGRGGRVREPGERTL